MDLKASLNFLNPGVLIKQRHSLTLNACAHCVFFCKVLLYIRQTDKAESTQSVAPTIKLASHSKCLHVGIIGAGQLGKQLARCLIDLSGLQAEDIRISTRRPETLRDFQELGVLCFYDNVGLATWAHIIFVCCLPSQLPNVCMEIRNHVGEGCIVYSLVSAVPLSRLNQLLGSRGVIRPEYRVVWTETSQEWDKNWTITAALRNATIVRSTSFGNPQGGIVRIVSRFIETTIYAALNMCTEQGLSHKQSLSALNAMIYSPRMRAETSHHSPLRTEDFVSREYATTLSENSPYPWFDLHCVQTKDTPFSQHLNCTPWLLERLTVLYLDSFGTSEQVTNTNNLAVTSHGEH
ncbi:NADP-dependent oxidoreductase domain-containing protein 1 [Pelobates fuscus]|uniref:NADP-dependent oxidoreductase domain-containing protein 1 n=1 Tax=Pelobates fuscus TaxID=191477 RepID=UPI002FE45957